MHTFFRIIDTHTTLLSKPAPLNARELAALRSRLRSAGIHSDFDHGELDGTAINFVYNANAIPLARYAGLFQHRIDVIEILKKPSSSVALSVSAVNLMMVS